MSYKIIFSDMDDTLLGSDLNISEKNRQAILKAQKIGVKFVICTGRGVYSIEKYKEQLELLEKGCYAVCQNGGTLYDLYENKLIGEKTFDSEIFLPMIEMARTYGVDIQLYYDRQFMIEKLTKRTESYHKNMNAPFTLLSDITKYKGKLTKCLLNGENEALKKIQNEAQEIIKGKLNMYFSKPEFLEFTSIEATKGTGMLELSKQLGIKQEEIIAIGDSYNDIHMIQLAGLGVAVANAADEVKQNADYITKDDCNKAPIEEVIHKFIFDVL